MDLKTLRRTLEETDQQLLELVARRQELSARIGTVKEQTGQHTRDFVQEKEVHERARTVARGLSLPDSVADELMTLLIRLSLTRQEKQRVVHKGEGSGRRVLVIGGAGRMGLWFARFLASQGFEVEVADPLGPVPGFEHRFSWQDGVIDQDVIVIAAPLRATSSILEEVAQRRPQGLIFDIGSLKSPLRSGLRKLVEAGLKATSIHPMFGPETDLLSGQHVIFVDLGSSEATDGARALFASTMAEQVVMSLEDHDRLIAYVLGLSHALNIAFFTALGESGEAAAKLARMSSTTFNAQLEVASKVAQDNPGLYFEIQSMNDYGTESLSALLYAVERLRSVVRAGDEEAFKTLMERGRNYLLERERRAGLGSADLKS